MTRVKRESIQKTGCPCCMDCCENPSIYNPEHKCKEKVCEECYILECNNCGKSCCHEL